MESIFRELATTALKWHEPGGSTHKRCGVIRVDGG
jgi:hypothetical protein